MGDLPDDADNTLYSDDVESRFDVTEAPEPISSSTDNGQSAEEPTQSHSTSSTSDKIQRSSIFSPELKAVVDRYKIKYSMAQHLLALQRFEIVIVCDDSGSMDTKIHGSNHRRWDRLRKIVKIVLEIAVIFDRRGIDIFFLNGPRVLGLTDLQQVDDLFSHRPAGYTPLVPVLYDVFQMRAAHPGHDKKQLVFIATDGAPTDGYGNPTVGELEHLMRNGRNAERTFVQFLLCTDDQQSISYLTGWDQTMPNVDVTGNFEQERDQVLLAGTARQFSFGDYVVKALVGAIDPEIDNLDEAL